MQRGVLILIHAVDIGSLAECSIDKSLHNRPLSSRRCHVQRSATLGVLCLDIRPCLEQSIDGSVVPRGSSSHQRRKAACVRSINVCLELDEKFQSLLGIRHCSEEDDSPLILTHALQRSSLTSQQLDDLESSLGVLAISVCGSHHKPGVPTLIHRVGLSLRLEKRLHNLLVANRTCLVQSGALRLVEGGSLCSSLEQRVDNICLSSRCSHHQRIKPVLILSVDVSLLLDNISDDIVPPLTRSLNQC
mmetsp:Transcript_22524/g.43719  ORF Transcript_22524/g.43719 Transcript_22524/m.43719 type:complete len:246 (+) Transcript_22524:651-1388(+)